MVQKLAVENAAAEQQVSSAFLVVDGGAVYEIAPNSVLNIGRLESNDIVLDDYKVSREHAVLKFAGGELTLVDLASTHGTFVNGERIDRSPLQFGDKIQIISHELIMSRSKPRGEPRCHPGVEDGAHTRSPAEIFWRPQRFFAHHPRAVSLPGKAIRPPASGAGADSRAAHLFFRRAKSSTSPTAAISPSCSRASITSRASSSIFTTKPISRAHHCGVDAELPDEPVPEPRRRKCVQTAGSLALDHENKSARHAEINSARFLPFAANSDTLTGSCHEDHSHRHPALRGAPSRQLFWRHASRPSRCKARARRSISSPIITR